MKVEVAAPVEYQGAVMGTLQRRHGIVRAQESTQEYFTVLCEVSAHRCTQKCSQFTRPELLRL